MMGMRMKAEYRSDPVYDSSMIGMVMGMSEIVGVVVMVGMFGL
jgi:hypothetical protein